MIRVVKPAAPAVLRTRGPATAQAHCTDHDSAPVAYRGGTKTFDFDSTIYAAAEVKDALRRAQHKKCAFCESFVPHVGYGDVEHFRPKAGYRQHEGDALKRPGYFWLAYDWDNLFFCCQICNQQFKRNLFPIRDGRRRAHPRTRDMSREEPLLVDPSRLDPSNFIAFHAERAVAPNGCREGKTTIRALGLNRPELVEARARRLETLRKLVRVRELLSEKAATAPTAALAAELAQVDTLLRESADSSGEYAAMARAFLRQLGLTAPQVPGAGRGGTAS